MRCENSEVENGNKEKGCATQFGKKHRENEAREGREEQEERGTYPIDDKKLATDILARIGGQKDNGPGKVLGLAPPPSWDALRDLAQPNRIGQEFLVPASVSEISQTPEVYGERDRKTLKEMKTGQSQFGCVTERIDAH